MATVEIVGLGPVQLDVPFVADIVPASMRRQRTGIPMKPARWIQHETGNASPNANAWSEREYLHSGANGQYVSYHFAVDDERIIQLIPVNEVAWHGGDGDGPCNMTGIAAELCVGSKLDKQQARANAEKLCAAVTEAFKIPMPSVLQHNFCYGKDCPHFMRLEGYWPTFLQNVATLRSGATPDPTPPLYATPSVPDWLQADLDAGTPRDHELGDSIAYGCRRWVTALRETPRYRYAARKNRDRVGPNIKKGESFEVTHSFETTEGMWYLTPWATRIWAGDVSPAPTGWME